MNQFTPSELQIIVKALIFTYCQKKKDARKYENTRKYYASMENATNAMAFQERLEVAEEMHKKTLELFEKISANADKESQKIMYTLMENRMDIIYNNPATRQQ
jgi:hypothetical protein